MNDQPNLEGIRSLYGDNLTARACIDDWAQRTNSQRETSVHRTLANLRNSGNEVVRSDVIKVFRKIAELGYGRFVTGRGGQHTRLEWSGDMVEIARSVTSGRDAARNVRKYSRRTPNANGGLLSIDSKREADPDLEVSKLNAEIQEKVSTIEAVKINNIELAERLVELEKEAANLKAENLAKTSIVEEWQRENAKIHDELRAADRRVGELEAKLQMQVPKAVGGSEPGVS